MLLRNARLSRIIPRCKHRTDVCILSVFFPYVISYRLELPDAVPLCVKVKPNQSVKACLEPILSRRGLLSDQVVAHLVSVHYNELHVVELVGQSPASQQVCYACIVVQLCGAMSIVSASLKSRSFFNEINVSIVLLGVYGIKSCVQ